MESDSDQLPDAGSRVNIYYQQQPGNYFTVYPGGSGTIETEFQQLMEFLLTKVDHKDTRAVKAAYGIYEKTLLDGYSITDIRDEIVRTRQNEGKRRLWRNPGEMEWKKFGERKTINP